MAKQNKPKPEMRLTFKLDPETTYKLKAKAKDADLAFPAYLRRTVLEATGLVK